jgi:hypothetical protein
MTLNDPIAKERARCMQSFCLPRWYISRCPEAGVVKGEKRKVRLRRPVPLEGSAPERREAHIRGNWSAPSTN